MTPDNEGQLDEIVGKVLQTSADEQTRNEAALVLIRQIERVAARVAASFSPVVRQNLEADAVSWVYSRLHRFQPGSRFEPWCRKVLVNRAIDLSRRTHEETTPDFASAIEQPLVNPGSDWAEETVQAAQVLLYSIQVVPNVATKVSFSAVFLLYFRVAVAMRMAKSRDTALANWDLDSTANWIASLFSWSVEQADWRLKSNWPTLQEIWRALTPRLDQPPGTITGEVLCEVVNSLPGVSPALTPDLWHKWVQRAKLLLRDSIGESRWVRIVEPIMQR